MKKSLKIPCTPKCLQFQKKEQKRLLNTNYKLWMILLILFLVLFVKGCGLGSITQKANEKNVCKRACTFTGYDQLPKLVDCGEKKCEQILQNDLKRLEIKLKACGICAGVQ